MEVLFYLLPIGLAGLKRFAMIRFVFELICMVVCTRYLFVCYCLSIILVQIYLKIFTHINCLIVEK